MKKDKLPFLFGSQYYRAPTPESECWADDLAKMRDIGFNQVKYWVQWRWSHRAPERFYWDDLDRLMDLAAKNGIGVTLNAIMDVSPIWLFEKYPNAKQIDIKGLIVEPFAIQHRQIGGQPGPCYNHAGALEERKKFLRAAVEHFRGHPAMQMWDVWNEPEQSYPRREPSMQNMTCYCPACRKKFIEWVRAKYETIEHLNDVWARCYESWEQVEMPRTDACVTDFIDWREFHLDVMTNEARWKLDLVSKHDPDSVAYLHVVPSSMTVFNAVTCVDDFDIADHCDVWAATMNQGPTLTTQVISAAKGKVAYNVESHVNFGSLRRHQRVVNLPMLLGDWLPQIGLGVKGFMYWQFRPEVTGTESPAWGVVRLDGSDRPVTQATREFWKTISPHVSQIMGCPAPIGDIGIYKSRKNELYHFCMDKNLRPLSDAIEGYLQNLYWMNYRFRFLPGQALERGELEGIKLLILPSAIYMTRREVDQLDEWVRAGGVVLCDAHLATYDGTRGRHTRQMPGMGLMQKWGIREVETTATQHLRLEEGALSGVINPDELKAWSGAVGGEFVPIKLTTGATAWGGGSRYAILESQGAEVLGSFDGKHPSILARRVGNGSVIYCGSNLGQGASRDASGLRELICQAAERAGVRRTLDAVCEDPDVHVDTMSAKDGRTRFVLIWNRSKQTQLVMLNFKGKLRGLFSGEQHGCDGPSRLTVAANSIDLYAVE